LEIARRDPTGEDHGKEYLTVIFPGKVPDLYPSLPTHRGAT
jgi:hypothetical protein